MTQLYIPKVNDQIKLLEDLHVKLVNDYRNKKFIENYLEFNQFAHKKDGEDLNVIIPKGTILEFSRIYIRQGASSDYNSVTFISKKSDNFVNGRFFISLEEANNIQFDRVINKTIKPVSLKKAITDLSSDIRKKEIDSCYGTSRRMAYEQLFSKETPIYSCVMRLNYNKAVNMLRIAAKDECSLRQLLNEVEPQLKDKSASVARLDFFFFNGEYAIKYTNLDSPSAPLAEVFGQAVNNHSFMYRTSILKQLELAFWTSRSVSGCSSLFSNFPWSSYTRLKELASNSALEQYSCLSFSNEEFGDLKKRLTKLKREENKKKKSNN